MNTITPMEGFKFGCDPELFVTDDQGRFVCADGLIPGTKEDPYKVEFGAVQVDGFAAEFNIDPVSTFEDFDRNIVQVMRQLKAMLPKGYELHTVPAVTFDKDVFRAAPDHAKVLGCTPDFNAWTGGVNPPPNTDGSPYLRTASGHIHIGWIDGVDPFDLNHVGHCRDLVKQLDYYLGGWSLAHDPDPVRRSLYGQAGACRFKPYGVEYRVLSNFWLKSKPHRRAVWNRTVLAINNIQDNFIPSAGDPHTWDERLIQAINTSKRDAQLENSFSFPLQTI